MADPRTFISFDYDHNETEKNLFIGQSKLSKSPFSIEDWSSKSTLPQSQWEAIVKEKINKCHILIVLVGKTMASASGVAKEIQMAKDMDKLKAIYEDAMNVTKGAEKTKITLEKDKRKIEITELGGDSNAQRND